MAENEALRSGTKVDQMASDLQETILAKIEAQQGSFDVASVVSL